MRGLSRPSLTPHGCSPSPRLGLAHMVSRAETWAVSWAARQRQEGQAMRQAKRAGRSQRTWEAGVGRYEQGPLEEVWGPPCPYGVQAPMEGRARPERCVPGKGGEWKGGPLVPLARQAAGARQAGRGRAVHGPGAHQACWMALPHDRVAMKNRVLIRWFRSVLPFWIS